MSDVVAKVKAAVSGALRPSRGAALYDLVRHGELMRYGWLDSALKGRPVDAKGAPLPWYTYPAIRFLESRLPRRPLEVFEYGCGNSTLWWAGRASRVTAVESSPQWAAAVRKMSGANVEVLEPSDYAGALAVTGGRFDVIINDADERNRCATFISNHLKDDGFVIWDNSDRVEEYQEGFDILLRQGFAKVDFIGMGPINTYEWATSIFYRPGNMLNL